MSVCLPKIQIAQNPKMCGAHNKSNIRVNLQLFIIAVIIRDQPSACHYRKASGNHKEMLSHTHSVAQKQGMHRVPSVAL